MKHLFLLLTAAIVFSVSLARAEEAEAPVAEVSTSMCLPITLPLCAQTVTIEKTSELGAAFEAQTNTGEKVTVQCVKEEDDIPEYQIKNADAVLCPF